MKQPEPTLAVDVKTLLGNQLFQHLPASVAVAGLPFRASDALLGNGALLEGCERGQLVHHVVLDLSRVQYRQDTVLQTARDLASAGCSGADDELYVVGSAVGLRHTGSHTVVPRLDVSPVPGFLLATHVEQPHVASQPKPGRAVQVTCVRAGVLVSFFRFAFDYLLYRLMACSRHCGRDLGAGSGIVTAQHRSTLVRDEHGS